MGTRSEKNGENSVQEYCPGWVADPKHTISIARIYFSLGTVYVIAICLPTGTLSNVVKITVNSDKTYCQSSYLKELWEDKWQLMLIVGNWQGSGHNPSLECKQDTFLLLNQTRKKSNSLIISHFLSKEEVAIISSMFINHTRELLWTCHLTHYRR